MSTVYIPQQPSRWDEATHLWVPSVNLNPAKKYGDLKIMFVPGAYDLALGPTIAAMKEQMSEFCADDYIVSVGDPSLIAAAAAIGSRKTGGSLRLLKWDRMIRDYVLTEFHV